jgi:hypothetical protein
MKTHPAPYTPTVRSKVARETARARSSRLARLSPAERLVIAARLTAEGIEASMGTHDVDRRTAIQHIKALHRMGRRPSASAAGDEH